MLNLRSRSIAAVFFYAVAANVPFWIASHCFGLVVKGWFNIEFAIIGILSLFVRRWITVALLSGAILADILGGIGFTYLLSASELFYSRSSLGAVAPSRIGDGLLLLTGIVLVCFAGWSISIVPMARQECRVIVSALLIFIGICTAIDVGTGHVAVLNPDRQLGGIRLTRSPVRYFYSRGETATHNRTPDDDRYRLFDTGSVDEDGKPKFQLSGNIFGAAESGSDSG